VIESDGRLLSRLDVPLIAHHSLSVFPYDRLPDPTKKEFSAAFPYCTLK